MSSSSALLIRDALLKEKINAEAVWDQLVEEAAVGQAAMEVGMHVALQCLQAAKAGLEAHCVEPSPKSFERVESRVKRAPADVQQRVHLYNAAAGNSSVGTVQFTGSGGTGDHVGEFDVWNMKAGRSQDSKIAKKQGTTMEVPSIRLDDVVENKIMNTDVFVLKVDTQGFEPIVLSGLSHSLQTHKIQFLLMEFWPHGMDMMAGREIGSCVAAEVLQNLLDVGYTLYALPSTCHPAAPEAAKRSLRDVATLPLHNVQGYCKWYYHIAERFPDDSYKMGYWSDILAVAPTASLKAVTPLGRALRKEL